jgi:GTP-dependent phosphoenolpyruvate carboxykinase
VNLKLKEHIPKSSDKKWQKKDICGKNMKATINIEIEGSKEEIDSITTKLTRFIEKQPNRIKVRPFNQPPPFNLSRRH